MVHLLDYLAADYAGAVQGGKVIHEGEYAEQIEFSKTVLDLARNLPEMRGEAAIQDLAGKLDGAIRGKEGPQTVASLARALQTQVMKAADFPTAPTQWPNLESGRTLFEAQCAKCHGVDGLGKGPSAPGLDPPPTSFFDPKMVGVAPLQAYNTIRLGVPGTSMAAFPTLSDQETWDLAFYVISFRHQNSLKDKDEARLFHAAASDLNLTLETLLPAAATRSDEVLLPGLKGSEAERKGKTAALRLRSAVESAGASMEFARYHLQEALERYKAGEAGEATRMALMAYLRGVELAEPRLRADNPSIIPELEDKMAAVRSAMGARKPTGEIEPLVREALLTLEEAESSLGSGARSPGLTFTLAFGIILREGFEALLLIAALLGVIRASGVKGANAWVHAGWLAALLLGGVAWALSGKLLGISGLGRELMEGWTAAVTVAILLYLGFWLHSRAELTQWNKFIQQQVKGALRKRNLFQLAALSFLAAFREVLETVLFLRAIWLEGGEGSELFLGLGVASSFTAILVLGWLLITTSAKVPVRSLFALSAWVMTVLAVILTGKAVHSFQEAGWLGPSPSPLDLRFEWLGLYPTWEAQLAQALVLGLSLLLYYHGKKPSSSQG
jgi:high-affinity iron transporter